MGAHVTEVKRVDGQALEARFSWSGLEIVFFKQNGRIKEKKRRRRYIPEPFYKTMREQARGILFERQSDARPSKRRTNKDILMIARPQGDEEERINVLMDYKTRILKSGGLRISRHLYNEDGLIIRVNQDFSDIAKAIRSQKHILENYFQTSGKNHPGELKDLEEIQADLEMAHGYFLIADHDQKKARQIASRLSRAADKLSASRHRLKKEAADYFYELAALEDSLARRNPSALAAKTVAAKNRLEKRAEAIKCIAPYIRARRAVLLLEEHQLAHNLCQAAWEIKLINQGKPDKTEEYQKKLNHVLYLLQSVWIEPFKKPGQKAYGLVSEAGWHIRQGALAKAPALLIAAEEICGQEIKIKNE